jgi:hypothetical protein
MEGLRSSRHFLFPPEAAFEILSAGVSPDGSPQQLVLYWNQLASVNNIELADFDVLINGSPNLPVTVRIAPGPAGGIQLQVSDDIIAPITASVTYVRSTTSITNGSAVELPDFGPMNIDLLS